MKKNLYYKAKGRNYYEEDIYITGKLKEHFDIVIMQSQKLRKL